MSSPPNEAGVAAGPQRRRRFRFYWTGLAALFVAALVALALGLDVRMAGRVQEAPEKLSLALSSTPHAALLHLAAAERCFADEGLDVSLTPVTHGKAALDLLTDGRVDLAAAAEVPFVVSVMEGHPLRAMASVASSSHEMAVVARRDRGVLQPADLIGKRIGVTYGTSGDYFLWAFLIRHRLAPERVTLVDIAPGRMVAELAGGRIDAASVWQPVRRAAEAALAGNGVSFTAPDAYTVTHLVVGRADSMERHPQAARRLVRALLRAESLSRAQPARARASVAGRLRLEPAELETDWGALDLRVDLRQSQLVAWEDTARWAVARGLARPGPMPNFLDHLHVDALQSTRPDRVTVVD